MPNNIPMFACRNLNCTHIFRDADERSNHEWLAHQMRERSHADKIAALKVALNKLTDKGLLVRNWGFVATTTDGKLLYANNLEISQDEFFDLLTEATIYVAQHGPAKSTEFEEISQRGISA